MSSLRVIVSGGGTGGHIFPAIAIANKLKQEVPDAEILFVGAEGRMEMEKVPAAGYKIIGLRISGLQRKLTLANLSWPFKVWKAVRRARKIIKDFKPDVAVGVGGYASGPMLYACAKKGIPCLVQEQNSYPGITNKILAKRVQRICVAYDNMDRFFPKEKIILTGNPVREEVVKLTGKRDRAMEFFKLDPAKKTLLVIGGSLGARTINHSVKNSLELFKEAGLQVLWQTGKGYIEQAEKELQDFDYDGVKAHQFINKMDYAYAIADIVVSRAGAMSVSELCLVQKPAILVPSPNVAEDHQTKNAMALVNHAAAILVKDVEARETLGKEVISLLNNEEQCAKLRKNIADLAFTNSVGAIVSEVLQLAKNSKN
jgi:UDP-N-acetylglucosamine--N-acetylmuramyl-(pentapeptide) pyrophosphoryl-undecaprenol N-acetylglucosamine transferase